MGVVHLLGVMGLSWGVGSLPQSYLYRGKIPVLGCQPRHDLQG